MNSVPNSDSEQCTKSKLGWVHQVHTLTQPVRTGRAHCSRWAPCRGVRCAVSWPPPRSYRGRARLCRKPGRPYRRLYHDTPSTKAMRAHRVVRYHACRSPKRRIMAHHGRVAACIAAILQYKSRSQPRYKVCIVTCPLARPCSRALPHAQRAGPPYRGLLIAISWRRLDCVVAESWPCRGPWLRTPALPSLAVSRYNQLYHDPAPNIGSSPSSCQKLFYFFFQQHFFSSF